MTDPTAEIRKALIEARAPAMHAVAAIDRGEPIWTTEDLKRDFEVLSFAAPFVVVRRKSDSVVGSLEFVHSPRVYFGFKEYGEEVDDDG